MQTGKVTLLNGLKIGDVVEKNVMFREGIIRDTLEISKEGNDQISLEIGLKAMARRITRFGDLEGPIDPDILAGLTEADYKILDETIAAFDQAIEAEAAKLLNPPKEENSEEDGSSSEGRSATGEQRTASPGN